MEIELVHVVIIIIFLGLAYLVMRGVTKRRRDRYKDHRYFKRNR